MFKALNKLSEKQLNNMEKLFWFVMAWTIVFIGIFANDNYLIPVGFLIIGVIIGGLGK